MLLDQYLKILNLDRSKIFLDYDGIATIQKQHLFSLPYQNLNYSNSGMSGLHLMTRNCLLKKLFRNQPEDLATT
ncbi:hypothetical protein SAMN05444955_101372 [Lihuaxuella thermophila]|uniref:Uncharacterized protein n=1 Tax=Lihuaxuella thermophila TaxID=1173111 RepID=A0A1H8AVM3_9BACL|nr:hypothetical protein SAMN05444955_101372 [Lihuaxuella thermophila]